MLIRNHGGLTETDSGGYDSVVFLEEANDYESFLQPGEEICGLGANGKISIKYVSLEGWGEEARVIVDIDIEDVPESTPSPSPTPSPTPTPTPTSTPTPTPTPCEADVISLSSGNYLTLKKKTSEKVTVTVTGANGCAVEGETVEAFVTTASGQKRITVSPKTAETDENGQVVFTITAQKKLGKATVAFEAGNLETLLNVKVSKK